MTKALILNLESLSLAAARLPQALVDAGFSVKLVALRSALSAATRFVDERHIVEDRTPSTGVVQLLKALVEGWAPAVIVATDDFAVWLLHDLWHEHRRTPEFGSLISLIERSLGEPLKYRMLERRSLFPAIAAQAQVRAPAQVTHSCESDAIAFARAFAFRVVVKADYTGGGSGVLPCLNERELISALKSVPRKTWSNGRTPVHCIQQWVTGDPVCVSLVAMNGELTAGFAFKQVQAFPTSSGPASVIHIIDEPELLEAAARLVEVAGYSGFAAIDFVRAPDGTFWALEFNARASGTSHLGALVGVDLCEAFLTRLGGTSRTREGRAPHFEIALFPTEWLRDPGSASLHAAYHDVPWNDPLLVRELVMRGLAFQSNYARSRS